MTQDDGIGICKWSDWTNLTEEQKQFEMHRVLTMLDRRTAGIEKTVKIYAFTGGVVGGFIAVLSIFGIKLVSGA